MNQPNSFPPIDYLVIGHLSIDITPEGSRLGGTAAYAALTAQALGLRAGIVTSWAEEIPLGPLEPIPINNYPAERSTSFENVYISGKRKQTLHSLAQNINYHLVPEEWRNASIVHLGPIAQEVEPGLIRYFSSPLVALTPQGWLRSWDETGKVYPVEWPEAAFMLEKAGAAVVSLEDIDGDEKRIEELAAHCQVLAVTEKSKGARLYWHGDVRRFPAPSVTVVDPTGAGDVFATAFFIRLYTTRDPWEAARFATQMATLSVQRPGLEGVPTPEEIRDCMVEVY